MLKFSGKQKVWFVLGLTALVAFVIWTLVVTFVDVNRVGLSHVNQFFWQLCGTSAIWKQLTDVLGFCLVGIVLVFIFWQVEQWICRKSWRRIDKNLLLLNVICLGLVITYIFFEIVVINVRPESGNGIIKASYPSSHVMLFATLLPILIWQVWYYIKSRFWCVVLTVILWTILVIGVVGRLLSGVHWFTDIVAGVLISCFWVGLYVTLVNQIRT